MLGVNGNNLTPCSAVQWNGTPRTTLYIGTTGLNAAISAADVASVATAQVSVVTPTPGGGTSGSLPFNIYNSLTAAVQKFTPNAIASSVSGSAGSLPSPAMSADKRYAAFVLASTDGVTETSGAVENVFVHDTCAGAPSGCAPSTSLMSVGVDSNPADGNSISPSISADGRYVAFISSADNLVAGDTNAMADVFVRDTCAEAASGCVPSTQRVSVASDGSQANGASVAASIGASGRYVVFQSAATNLDLASGGVSSGMFLRDTCAGTSSGCTPSTQRVNPRD
jgi:hypothetical protein